MTWVSCLLKPQRSAASFRRVARPVSSWLLDNHPNNDWGDAGWQPPMNFHHIWDVPVILLASLHSDTCCSQMRWCTTLSGIAPPPPEARGRWRSCSASGYYAGAAPRPIRDIMCFNSSGLFQVVATSTPYCGTSRNDSVVLYGQKCVETPSNHRNCQIKPKLIADPGV